VPGTEVDIAVMGPVTVRGAAHPFRRSASLELAVYLAFHRRGVRHAEWSAALWPDRPVASSSVHSTASDARRALGHAADGNSHLPRGAVLRLGAGVATDVERFAALGRSDDPRRLVEAMHLVRGPVFAGLRHVDWAIFDGTQPAVETMIVRTAVRGAGLLARLGRGEDAEWVVRRAMAACPFDERLYRALLRAAAVQGNRVGLRSTMGQLLTLAGDGVAVSPSARPHQDHALLRSLHPSTMALYRDLLRGLPAAGGTPPGCRVATRHGEKLLG
jgi:DNA-binding SARP family transcriptional activator